MTLKPIRDGYKPLEEPFTKFSQHVACFLYIGCMCDDKLF